MVNKGLVVKVRHLFHQTNQFSYTLSISRIACNGLILTDEKGEILPVHFKPVYGSNFAYIGSQL
jgi:hypothetical protein